MANSRLPDATQKRQLLNAIARATQSIPRAVALRVVGQHGTPSRKRWCCWLGGDSPGHGRADDSDR